MSSLLRRRQRSSSILDEFALDANRSIEHTLALLQNDRRSSSSFSSSSIVAKQNLSDLLAIEAELNKLMTEKMEETKAKIVDCCKASSPFLSLTDDLQSSVLPYLNEEALWALEQAAVFNVWMTMMNEEIIMAQWNWLDERRGRNKSKLHHLNCPRQRGIQFAKASQYAHRMEDWATTRGQYQKNPNHVQIDNNSGCVDSPEQIYGRENFRRDFGEFYKEEEEEESSSSPPLVEFFIRLSYRKDTGEEDCNDDDTVSVVLLEGFQSTFISLSDADEAQDHGMHTYIGAGSRTYAVLVRDDIHLIQDQMGLNLETDYSVDDDEFDLLKWPATSRVEFLDRLSITVLLCRTCSSSSNAAAPLQLIGSTTGYAGSEQYFAMFPPQSTDPKERVANPEDCLKVGLGCGVADSFHIILEWGRFISD